MLIKKTKVMKDKAVEQVKLQDQGKYAKQDLSCNGICLQQKQRNGRISANSHVFKKSNWKEQLETGRELAKTKYNQTNVDKSLNKRKNRPWRFFKDKRDFRGG